MTKGRRGGTRLRPEPFDEGVEVIELMCFEDLGSRLVYRRDPGLGAVAWRWHQQWLTEARSHD